MPILPIIWGLAQLVPSILPFFSNDETANTAAEAVSKVASAVAGTDNLEDAVKAIAGNPEKEAEFRAKMLDHIAQMYQAETERLKIEAEDRDSARKMQIETHDPTPRYLALGVFLIWSFVQVWMMTRGLPTGISEAVVQRALGMLDSIMMIVVTFYFGSSLGSKLKTDYFAGTGKGK